MHLAVRHASFKEPIRINWSAASRQDLPEFIQVRCPDGRARVFSRDMVYAIPESAAPVGLGVLGGLIGLLGGGTGLIVGGLIGAALGAGAARQDAERARLFNAS
jgi:hypothetical protein